MRVGPGWGVGGFRQRKGRTLDLKAVYKQWARSPLDESLAVIAVWASDSQSWEYYLSHALPFGAVASVYAFNRLARAFCRIAAGLFHLVLSNYFDAYLQLERELLADSAQACLEGLADALGLVPPADDAAAAAVFLREAAATLGTSFTEEPGEAAFYGPKIDFVVKDVIGREWQLGTVQVDYNLPERFGLEYIGSDNAPHRPVMIHRAPFGSMERFVGVLIEHFAGKFPTWLAPEQVRVLPISEKFDETAREVVATLRAEGVRVTIDDSSDKVGAKIRLAQLARIPYMLVIGAKEQESNQVSVRHRERGDEGAIAVGEFRDRVVAEIRSRSL